MDYSKSPAIQNMPVTSQISEPENGSAVKVGADGTVKVKGYAYSGGGNRIIRVDLTADQGKTWFEGTIEQQEPVKEPRHYGWTLWSAKVKVRSFSLTFSLCYKNILLVVLGTQRHKGTGSVV